MPSLKSRIKNLCHKGILSEKDYKRIATALGANDPCNLCRFNPPSACDGKPCTMCPAEAKGDEEWSKQSKKRLNKEEGKC